LFGAIETQGENTHQHSTELGDLSIQLRQTAEDYPAVGSLIENVVAVTRKMREENQELESNLAASTNEISSLRRNVEAIQKEAMSDPLTGISNRKSFDRAVKRLITEAHEGNKSLAVIMADVDHFKLFNDQWGHQTGDQVLRLVAEVMNANVKGQDMLARYGGEEFAILLPGTALENAHMLADRIRRAVESRRLKKRQSNEDLGLVTMSMGVASFKAGDTVATLVERADQSLYIAKKRGRNCVIDERELTQSDSLETELG
jgi:diguanylate cyclase